MSETDLKVELSLDSTWTDISTYVRYSDSVVITRGRSDETSSANPSTCRMTLDNRDGRFSSRNPVGAYYGSIGRNTQLRVSVPYGESYLNLPQTDGASATTPDAAVLDITGDIDIRLDATPRSWRVQNALAAKYEITSDERSWAFYLDDEGILTLLWSSDGTLAARRSATSTIAVPFTSGRHAVRATLDVVYNVLSYLVTFYTADDIDSAWTQLGDPVEVETTTSIYSGTADVEVGYITDLDADPFFGKIHAFELYDGIAGTLVANPDFRIQTVADTSFADTTASPRTWTVAGGAEIDDRNYRFHGEVSSWPSKRDQSGVDVYVPIEASGVLRRLTQGESPLKSTMYRTLTRDSSMVAYWPMEDPEGSTRIASALSNGTPMKFSGTPTFGSNTAFAASEALPVAGSAVFKGAVPPHTATDAIQVSFLMQVPAAGATTGQILCTINATGTARRWELVYTTGGSLTLRAFDADDVSLGSEGPIAFAVNGILGRVSIIIQQDGGDVTWFMSTLEQDSTSGFYQEGTSFVGTVGRATAVSLASNGGLTDTAFGHLAVQTTVLSIFDAGAALSAFRPEEASARILRLGTEESVSAASIGYLATEMGYQGQKTLVELLRECEDSDVGILYESRWRFGLEYRERVSLYNQTAVLALDYHTGHELSSPLDPVDDDQKTLNDITVTRIGGSFSRVTLDTGALSTLAPPNGIGKYDTNFSVSLNEDEDTLDQAGWRLHLYTVDEARYPTIAINLRHSTFDVAAMWDAAIAVDIGDRITIDSIPSDLPPDQISLLTQGYTEVIGGMMHDIVFNCSPESPYQIGYLDSTDSGADNGRIDTDGSELRTAVNSTATELEVNTTEGQIWVFTDKHPAEFPFDISLGGEVVTVTAISGADGDFENGVAGWSPDSGTFVQSSAQNHRGTYSGLLTVTGAPSQTIVRPIQANAALVTVGTDYTCSFWAYSTPGDSISAAIDWSDSSHGYLSTSAAGFTLAAATWTLCTASGTAPASAAFASYGPTITGSPTAGDAVFIDDVTFTPYEAQVFTVTRSVNGVVKSQTAGTDVRLTHPGIISL